LRYFWNFMKDLRVAAVCMRAAPSQVEKNLEKIRSLALEAAARGAQFVCFPELSVTGYILKEPSRAYEGMTWAQALDRLCAVAREARIVLMAGLIEGADDGKPFITQAVAGPEGLIGLYRKTHLSPMEKRVYQAGQEAVIFTYGATRFGLQLCYETHFPEISTVMALQGAHVLFLPHASPRGTAEEKVMSWFRHLPARAFDNGLFLVACNQVGHIKGGMTFPGAALVLGPDGRLLSRYAGEKEHILLADLKSQDLKGVKEHTMRYFLPHRRPELYKGILNGLIWPTPDPGDHPSGQDKKKGAKNTT